MYWEDWGEGLTSKSVPVLCVADVAKGTVTVLQGVPSHVSPGQVSANRASHTHTHPHEGISRTSYGICNFTGRITSHMSCNHVSLCNIMLCHVQ